MLIPTRSQWFFESSDNSINIPEIEGILMCGAADREHVNLSVTDQGAGISRSEQEKIFDKFYRGSDR